MIVPIFFGLVLGLASIFHSSEAAAVIVSKTGSCGPRTPAGDGASGQNASCTGGLLNKCEVHGANGAAGAAGGSGGHCTVTVTDATPGESIIIKVNVAGGHGGKGGAGGAGKKCGFLGSCNAGSEGAGGPGGPGGRVTITSNTPVTASQIKFSGCPVSGGKGGAGNGPGAQGALGAVLLNGKNITSQFCH